MSGVTQDNVRNNRSIPWGVAAQMAAWLVAALLTYAAVTRDVAVLQSKYDSLERYLIRIDEKVDRLLVRGAYGR